jgi:exonuclease VII small subunit
VNDTHGHPVFSQEDAKSEANYDEMAANIVLCYRHLEDAAMRLGKAIQAYDGGKSVYDKD